MKNFITSASIIRMIKDDEMFRSCSTNGEEECIQVIDGKARRKETTRMTKTKVG
jgi:hypothetical protein